MKRTRIGQNAVGRSRVLMAALLAAVMVLAAACGRDREPEPTATPEATATSAPAAAVAAAPTATQAAALPTNTPATVATAPDQPSADRSAIASPSDVLSSFRTRGVLRIESTLESGEVTNQDIQFELAHVQADNEYGYNESYRMVDNSPDAEAGSSTVELYQVDDQIAMRSGGEWLTLSRAQGGPFAATADIWLSSTQGFGQFMAEAQEVGRETINGVATTHYRLDEAELYRIFTQETEEQTGIQTDLAQAEIWLADDGNYVVKYVTSAELSNVTVMDEAFNEVKAQQVVNMTMELYDIGGAVEVVWPEDAPEPGVAVVPGFAPGEFPIPPNSEMTSNVIGMPEVVSQLSQDEVVTFYRDTLSGLGWSFAGDYGVYTATKDGSTLNFVFSADPGTGATKVSIYGE